MDHSQICLDLSIPLHMRLEHLKQLQTHEVDNVLECICSMYNIHPTFTALQYLQTLILQRSACLRRRIRIAETCDLGPAVLYLLTRITDFQERIGCIEMFTNPHLKRHAYAVLFTHASVDVQIQIMKNWSRLMNRPTEAHAKWFLERMEDLDLEYKYRANCADFIIQYLGSSEEMIRTAKSFLRLLDPVTYKELYAHRENVHLFVPRAQALKAILTATHLERCATDEIVEFLVEHNYNERLFHERILNDKSQLGTAQWSCTLEELLQRIWRALTEDLRHMLIQDIESSVVLDEPNDEWMCTTGYYNRILNVYQSIVYDESMFDVAHEREQFQQRFFEHLNQWLNVARNKDDLIVNLSESGDAQRIEYLTFRVHSLPNVIDALRVQYSYLRADQFDEWISDALRAYEH